MSDILDDHGKAAYFLCQQILELLPPGTATGVPGSILVLMPVDPHENGEAFVNKLTPQAEKKYEDHKNHAVVHGLMQVGFSVWTFERISSTHMKLLLQIKNIIDALMWHLIAWLPLTHLSLNKICKISLVLFFKIKIRDRTCLDF